MFAFPRFANRLFLGLIVLASPAAAQQPSPSPAPTWPLPPASHFIELLSPPPRPGSFRDRMDYRDALAWQKQVTPQNRASIQETYNFDVFYFSRLFGPKFTAKNYPLTARFFGKLIATANAMVSQLKNHYKRPRPFVTHPEIHLLVRNEPGYSYPSGHTTRSRLSAMVLAELIPSASREIMRTAEVVATDRILAGEHYQTDVEAGRRLAKLIFRALNEDPSFRHDLEALKASSEWTPSPALHPQKREPIL